MLKWFANKPSFVSIEIVASKSSDANQGRAPRETTGEITSKIGVDFGPEGGVDVAWIFLLHDKKGRKFRSISGQSS